MIGTLFEDLILDPLVKGTGNVIVGLLGLEARSAGGDDTLVLVVGVVFWLVVIGILFGAVWFLL